MGGLDQAQGRILYLFKIGFFSRPLYSSLLSAIPPWAKIFPTIIAIYLIAEMVLLPTSYAFGGIPHLLPLRALAFVFANYVSICMAFGLLYLTLCRFSFNIAPDLIDLAYFSFTTMTALGIGDITPARHTLLVRFLVVFELLIGIYFWAVLVGIIISWTAMEAKNDRSLPK
jgi:Ion channel